MSNQPTILLGCPIRNDHLTEHEYRMLLGAYFTHIYSLDYPPELISLYFLVNDAPDSVFNDLQLMMDGVTGLYRRAEVVRKDFKHTPYKRDETNNFTQIARVRNEWLHYGLQDEEYVFSVDSDVLIPPESLTTLLRHNKPICSLLVRNHPRQRSICNIMQHHKVHRVVRLKAGADFSAPTPEDFYRHIRPNELPPNQNPAQVDLTGAAYLYKSELIHKGVRYGYHLVGEDAFFCQMAKELGYTIWVDTKLETRHVMNSEIYQELVQEGLLYA